MSKQQRIKARVKWLWKGTWKRVRALGIGVVLASIFFIIAVIWMNAWESGTTLFRNALLVFMDDSIVLRISAAILSILFQLVILGSYIYFTNEYDTKKTHDSTERNGFTDADIKTLLE